jgi:putative tryptophan/tyrosine transport system substrate-binding protein
MRRREFIAGLGSAVAPSVLHLHAARAQQPRPTIGFLHSAMPVPYAPHVVAFERALREAGYTIGQNVAVEYRWAEDHYERLQALTADLVRRRVAVIVASGPPAAQAAKAATTAIPIVFMVGADPIGSGLVANLNRPGGNLTGFGLLINVLVPKQLEVLHELVQPKTSIGVLVNPENPNAQTDIGEAQEAARALGHPLLVRFAKNEADIEAQFAMLAREKAGGLVVVSDPMWISRRDQLVALAARYEIPAIYPASDLTAAGGLVSYGTSLIDAYGQGGTYAARILKGEKPGDMPVQLPTRFEMSVNLKAARALGLTVPPSILLRADEVIE